MGLKIKWSKISEIQLTQAITYIEEYSSKNAIKVLLDILEEMETVALHPEKYAPDKYKLENDGSFRAFELHKYRISCRFLKHELRIVRIRHTKMNPSLY